MGNVIPDFKVVPGCYRHYQGELYDVLKVIEDSTNWTNNRKMVLYRSRTTGEETVRDIMEFTEFLIDWNMHRFEPINERPETYVYSLDGNVHIRCDREECRFLPTQISTTKIPFNANLGLAVGLATLTDAFNVHISTHTETDWHDLKGGPDADV